jgi:deazaflavin-dependent oxidoreductase (nitroreductase family)
MRREGGVLDRSTFLALVERAVSTRPADAFSAQLAQVRAYEQSVRRGPLTAAARQLGRTRAFAAAYRRIGPIIDPRIAPVANGQLMAKLYGFPLLILHTVGAKSGQPRTSPLLYVRDGNDVLVLGTNFGQAKNPGWVANLRQNPEASIEIGPFHLPVTAHQISQPEWDAQFPRFVEVYPGYRNYLERRGALTPLMFRLRPIPPASRGTDSRH